MADLMRADLNNYKLTQELHLDKYAQHILENGKSVAASTPTITTLSGSDFLQKLSATILNSIQLQQQQQQQQQLEFAEQHTTAIFTPSTTTTTTNMDLDIVPNHIAIDSSNFGTIDDLQKQLEYDKFMNDVWIGIVMTLILISMVFCICSCFLYHQFRTWKQNYHANVTQSQAHDIESMKLNPDATDDPVPEYTLVSGLPTYEAALELLQKTPNSCVIVYPTVFNIFNKNEKMTDIAMQQQQQQQQQLATIEVTTPLIATNELTNVKSQLQVPSYMEAIGQTATATATNDCEKSLTKMYAMIPETTTTATAAAAAVTLQKVPSYEEALLVKNDN